MLTQFNKVYNIKNTKSYQSKAQNNLVNSDKITAFTVNYE